MAVPLPAPWAGEPPQVRRVDNASVGFSGDCAMLELQNRSARSHDIVALADLLEPGGSSRGCSSSLD
jgi:hypothetical protein